MFGTGLLFSSPSVRPVRPDASCPGSRHTPVEKIAWSARPSLAMLDVKKGFWAITDIT